MAWLVMQVADVILNNIEAPGWVFHVLLLFLAVGFAFAMFFAWAFELTPERLKREHEVDRTQSITANTGRKLDYAIIGILLLALGYFSYDKFFLSGSREAANLEVALGQAKAAPAEPAETDKSIAVLPFVNMSDDTSNEYFSDGLSEELLNLLAKIPELRVIARTSSFAYKGKDVQISDVARDLNVANILEGSVRKDGNQVRVTAQLIRTDDSSHLWSETYDRTLDNIFAIQDEIAEAVVDELKITLLGEAPKIRETDPQAYALFLQGRHHGNNGSLDQQKLAVGMYKQVLDIDPGYADAWAEMGRSYANLAYTGNMSSEQGFLPAIEALDKAISLDPENAAAYSRLGWVAMARNHLHVAAKHLQLALELEPGSTIVLGNASQLLAVLGRFDEAKALDQMVMTLDPANPNSYSNASFPFYYSGDLDRTIELTETTLRLNPGYWGADYLIGASLLAKNESEAARTAFDRENWELFRTLGLALASHSLGQESESESALGHLRDVAEVAQPSLVATAYAWVGNADAAFEWLEKALNIQDSFLTGCLYDPLFVKLHDDPRWPIFWEKVGLSPAQLATVEFEVSLPD